MRIGLMCELSEMKPERAREAGFTIIQMAVTIAIAAVVMAFGVMAVTRAKRDMALSGEIRKFSSFLEKGRIEAVRRRTSVAVVTINSNSSYTVTLDSNYDGTLSAYETRTVPLPDGVTFNTSNITFPATITYNLLGRSSFTNITGSSITMTNTNGTTTNVTLTGGGDVTLDSTITGPAANTNLAPSGGNISTTANIKNMN
jgi:Tfp pilus assembly protein FimT